MTLHRRLPSVLEFALATSLPPTLTHSITHAIVPVVAKALMFDNSQCPFVLCHSCLHISRCNVLSFVSEQAEVCRRCYYLHIDCAACHFSAKDSYYLNYYAAYYSDYYADYYSKYYSEAALQYQLARLEPH